MQLGPMKAHQVLERAIPRMQSGRVAQLLSVSADYVRRWRREPDSDESPTASGQRSILDRICDLIDAVYLVNPIGSALIVDHITAHYDSLLRTHAVTIPSRELQAEAGADLLTQATEAVNAIHVDGCTHDTLVELVQLRDAADLIIKQVQKTISQEDLTRVS